EIDAVKINKANNAPKLNIINATYEQTLADVKDQLPAGWTFVNDLTTVVGNATAEDSYNEFVVEYKSNNSNYMDIDKTVGTKVKIAVAKADNAPALPQQPYTATYADKLSTITLPAGWAFVDEYGEAINVTTTDVGNATAENEYNTFNVKYTPKNTNNYITKTGTVTIKVAKATPSYDVPSELTANYNQTLADVELPDGFAWEEADTTKVGNAGTQTHTVKFTPNDEDNYNVVTNISVTIEVAKINPSYDVPTGLTANYNQTLADIELPDGFAWEEADTTKVGNAGTQTHTVKFTPNDEDNYNVVTNISVTIEVAKIDPSYTAPSNLSAIYGQTLANVTLPTGFKWVKAENENDTVTWVEDNTTPVGAAGNNTFYVKYTPTDIINYNVVEGIEVTVQVAAASVPADTTLKESLTVDIPNAEDLVYNKEPKKATVTSTIEGLGEITVKYYKDGKEVTSPVDSGTYDIKITIADSDNYNGTAEGTVIDLGQSMTITPSPITIKIHDKTSKYGEAIQEFKFTREGTKYDGDTLGITLSTSPALTTVTSVGKYNITGTAANPNYDVTFVNKDDDTKEYGIYTITEADPEYTTPSGLTANYNQTLADVTLPTATNGTF
ncbi:MAG: MBG domain-containing protein, partial [Clostridia bacterium]|nr:MBG domain-containing protein [Clostridia bacterium]